MYFSPTYQQFLPINQACKATGSNPVPIIANLLQARPGPNKNSTHPLGCATIPFIRPRTPFNPSKQNTKS